MAFQPIDGPLVYTSISVGTSAVLLKVGASNLEERQMVSIQPLNDVLYIGYDNTVTSSNAALKIFKGQYVEIERGSLVNVWAISPTPTNTVLFSELS